MKKLCTLLFVIIGTITMQAQTKVGDATLPNKVNFNEETLQLNGTGIREKFFFDIYAAGLYLKEKSGNAQGIASADQTMAIKMDILSGMMSRSKMEGALRDGFKKATSNNTASLDKRIDTFVNFIKDEIEVGQVYDVVYEKGKGSSIFKNGTRMGTIEGLDFKKALFNIWLGDKPADKDLKNGLLNK